MSHNLPVVVLEVGRKLIKEIEDYLEEPDVDYTSYQQNLELYPKIMKACYKLFSKPTLTYRFLLLYCRNKKKS